MTRSDAVKRSRVDEDARVQYAVWIEHVLDRGHDPQRLARVHDRQQLAARPPVAVLARQRAAVPDDEVGGLDQELPHAVGAVARP